MAGINIDFTIKNQKGTPAFYSDIFANRPTYGYPGRVFISTDTGAIYEDTGSAWTLIADAGAGTTGTLQQVTTNGKTTDQGINITAGGLTLGTATGDNQTLLNLPGTNVLIYREVTSPSTDYGFNIGGSSPNSFFLTNTEGGYCQTLYFGDAGTSNIFGISASNDSGVTWNAVLVVNQDNKVGINKNNPTCAFDVLGSGVFSGTLSVGATAIPSGFSGTKLYSGISSPTESHIYNMGVVGTATADSGNVNIWGVGVYGAGYTNGSTRGAGVQGDGEVSASGDSGSAIGVRGYATATHSGGLNIGMLADASGSGVGNYGFYSNMTYDSTSYQYSNYHLGTAPNLFNSKLFVNNPGNINASGVNSYGVELTSDANGGFFVTTVYNDTYNTAPALGMRKSRGTQASPTGVQNGDVLGAWFNTGYTSGGAFGGNIGVIRCEAAETFALGSTGTRFTIATTAVGAGGRTIKVSFEPDGVLILNNGSTNNGTSAILQVNGSISGSDISLTGATYSTSQTITKNYYNIFTGGAGQTLTLPSPLSNNYQYVFVNTTANSLTISASSGCTITDLTGSSVASITLIANARCFIIADGSTKYYQVF